MTRTRLLSILPLPRVTDRAIAQVLCGALMPYLGVGEPEAPDDLLARICAARVALLAAALQLEHSTPALRDRAARSLVRREAFEPDMLDHAMRVNALLIGEMRARGWDLDAHMISLKVMMEADPIALKMLSALANAFAQQAEVATIAIAMRWVAEHVDDVAQPELLRSLLSEAPALWARGSQ